MERKHLEDASLYRPSSENVFKRVAPKVEQRIPLLLSTKNSSEERRQSKAETTPRSPLMTVAKTVKNKFSKLTRIGRHEQDISMKGSQSFSGIRQLKSAIPKRIDQNANRVIKSSSMEVPSTSQETSGSSGTKRMVVIPQNPKHLEDFSEESSLAETVVQKNTSGIVAEEPEEPPKSQEPKQSLSVTLSEDVLVITQELPLSVQCDERTDIIDSNGKTQRIHEKATAFGEHRIKNVQVSKETRNVSPSRKQHTFTLGEKIPDTSSELKATESQKSNEKIEMKSALDKMGPAPRFIMTIKTPEPMRKHQTFFIGLADAPVTGTVAVSSPEKKKKKKTKIVKQRSMPEASVSPERYVMRMKTPETLRRHHTFTIRERSRSPDVPYIEEGEITEPVATVGMTATKKETTKEKEGKRPNEKESTNEKSTVSVKTPSALRKLKTYIAEEKPKLKTVSSSKSADTFLSSKTSNSEHSQIVKRTAKPQIFLQSKKMQKAMENNESERASDYVKKFTPTTAVVPVTNTRLQALLTRETKVTDQPETMRTMEQMETVVDLEREKEILENLPLKTAEMYMLTMMTPTLERKETNVERSIDEEPPERSSSPENVSLLVMGRRSHSRNCQNSGEKNSVETEASRYAVVRPHRGKIEFDRKEQSQSDRAELIERKTSELSCEMTSPEEEIPMDTHLTPSEELHRDDALITRSIQHLSLGTSSYNRAPEVAFSDLHIYGAIETLLFQPPSPPKEAFKPITLSKSTSPLKIKGHSDNAVDEAKDEMKRLLNSRSKFVDRKEKLEERERLKLEKREKQNSPRPPKAPITARLVCACHRLRVGMFVIFYFQDQYSILERYPRKPVCYPK
ncbi:unnamed protein product [Angiostrongylus costaricensis]|uniref:G2/mitotic-specific cyclin-B3 n=1 Tax=Angiostrongylus costaricensis TaxID=334426 RepID=A0A158PF60_ANGCS|nr:unnamed protein product [Angiostrongylus costaricensis]